MTLVDFTEAGDMAVFIDEEQLALLEKRMQDRGYLEAHDMATSFNMLRANDLIWSFVVNNYLLGKEPIPFDLLFWNSDSTRMPAAMHSFYLRNMYQQNLLAKPGGVSLAGTPIDLRKIKTPSFLLSTGRIILRHGSRLTRPRISMGDRSNSFCQRRGTWLGSLARRAVSTGRTPPRCSLNRDVFMENPPPDQDG